MHTERGRERESCRGGVEGTQTAATSMLRLLNPNGHSLLIAEGSRSQKSAVIIFYGTDDGGKSFCGVKNICNTFVPL